MKRVLLVMNQPPGCSGVQGLIYNKILPYLEEYGWEFHFAGPDPRLASVLTESLDYPADRLHYTRNVSPSLVFSIFKHRHSKGSPIFLLYAFLQLVFRSLETLIRHDSRHFLCQGLRHTVRAAEQQWDFDLIGGKSPAFDVLVTTSQLVQELNKPFLAMIVDPYGRRDLDGFVPYEFDVQRQILKQCCGSMYMSPLTRQRYIDAGLVEPEKAFFFTDSFSDNPELYRAGQSSLALSRRPKPEANNLRILQLLHLGMLPEWRPVEPLLEALLALNSECGDLQHVRIDIYGYLYPRASALIRADQYLRTCVQVHPMVGYGASHWLAEDADVQLVIIGPRHLDNLPSKFFEYLGHRKPVLVLGPLGNPISEIVNRLGVGVYADINSKEQIIAGLRDIAANYSQYQLAFKVNAEALDHYSARQVAKHWCECLDTMTDSAKFKSSVDYAS